MCRSARIECKRKSEIRALEYSSSKLRGIFGNVINSARVYTRPLHNSRARFASFSVSNNLPLYSPRPLRSLSLSLLRSLQALESRVPSRHVKRVTSPPRHFVRPSMNLLRYYCALPRLLRYSGPRLIAPCKMPECSPMPRALLYCCCCCC